MKTVTKTLEQLSKEFKLKQKSYCVDFSKIVEGYTACEVDCVADTLGKAKKILLFKIQYDGWILDNGEDIKYTNIPVIRNPAGDLYEFEGNDTPLFKISQILEERERLQELDDIINNEKIKYCFIRKHGSFYRPGSCGYTDFKVKAGVYTKEEAVSHARSCNEITVVPIDIEEHNKYIMEEINELKERYITE